MRGKAGVISVLREADLHLHLGENATDGADGADPTKLQVGECEPDAGNAPNVTRHTIEPELEQRMRRHYLVRVRVRVKVRVRVRVRVR